MVNQANDRIGNDLSGAVEGDIAAAIALDDLDFKLIEGGLRCQQVPITPGPAAERNDRRVLDQEQLLFRARQHLLMCRLLSGPGLLVGHRAQVLHNHGLILSIDASARWPKLFLRSFPRSLWKKQRKLSFHPCPNLGS